MSDIQEAVINEEERDWLIKAQQGNDEAFVYIVDSYQRPVYNLCYRMLGNAGDAEDAAQETFIRAYKAINRYDIKRKFSTWLLSIASNYCIDQIRKKKLPAFSYDSLPVPDIKDDSPWLESIVINEEKQGMINNILDQLKPKDRSAVVLHYWYDHSYEEIADALDLTASAVKSRLHRARKELATNWITDQKSQEIPLERTSYETTI
ncbi:MAG: sigma-70 family RNA polymerase sigma factor [Chloroflexota bacterium]